MSHNCDAFAVMCMDFRFQRYFDEWLLKNLGHGNYDRVSFAGGVKSWDIIFSQLEISKRLHHSKKVVLINHEDCGAYGAEDSPERHASDLRNAREKVLQAFPDSEVLLLYCRLDGEMETVL
jgi:carbonic anhydrase